MVYSNNYWIADTTNAASGIGGIYNAINVYASANYSVGYYQYQQPVIAYQQPAPVVRAPTPEESQRMKEEAIRLKEAADERARKLQEANLKAEALLKEILTESEYQALKRSNLHVTGEHGEYIIYCNPNSRIKAKLKRVVEDQILLGDEDLELCVVPSSGEILPDADRLIQKILLAKYDDEHLLKVAVYYGRNGRH